MSNAFNIFGWSQTIPFCDDIWFGMQARNIALVDFTFLRPMEDDALEAFLEREKTPTDILLPLSALSQMWAFSLYEFLRTWRQRADFLLKWAADYETIPADERDAFKAKAKAAIEGKRRMLRIGPEMYAGHLELFFDASYVEKVKTYRAQTDGLFREVEALRVTLAKHEVPKTNGLLAEAPGYGRMSYENGSMYWAITLKDNSQMIVERRSLADEFLRLDSSPI